MLVKVVGIQDQTYTLDSGYSFDGLKLHCLDLETASDKLQGNVTTTIKVPRNFPYISSIKVGATFTVYFNQKGGLDFLRPEENKS